MGRMNHFMHIFTYMHTKIQSTGIYCFNAYNYVMTEEQCNESRSTLENRLPKYRYPSCRNCAHHDPEIIACHSDGSEVSIHNVCTKEGLYQSPIRSACRDYVPKTKENMEYAVAIWNQWIHDATSIIENENGN